tara:strand:+ start:415 stop:1173 length:759 start_codon:yes stop_codon:yes gene_type:complete
MSYVGCIKAMADYCAHLRTPTVLEIGVDRGQTTLPLFHNLHALGRPFKYMAVDIRVDDDFAASLEQMHGYAPGQSSADPMSLEPWADWNIGYVTMNSFDFLPLAVERGWKFDLVLIDGDHNYPTVKHELSFINQITYPTSLVICDDYSGKHSEVDTFYKDHPLHSDVTLHRDIVPTPGKAGVKPAVNEWLQQNPLWKGYATNYEPIVLVAEGLEWDGGAAVDVPSRGGFRPYMRKFSFTFKYTDRCIGPDSA